MNIGERQVNTLKLSPSYAVMNNITDSITETIVSLINLLFIINPFHKSNTNSYMHQF